MYLSIIEPSLSPVYCAIVSVSSINILVVSSIASRSYCASASIYSIVSVGQRHLIMLSVISKLFTIGYSCCVMLSIPYTSELRDDAADNTGILPLLSIACVCTPLRLDCGSMFSNSMALSGLPNPIWFAISLVIIGGLTSRAIMRFDLLSYSNASSIACGGSACCINYLLNLCSLRCLYLSSACYDKRISSPSLSRITFNSCLRSLCFLAFSSAYASLKSIACG